MAPVRGVGRCCWLAIIGLIALACAAFTPAPGLAATPHIGSLTFKFQPVYPGHNSNVAMGAVGSHAELDISGLRAGGYLNANVSIYLIPTLLINLTMPCDRASGEIALGSTSITEDTLNYPFLWPDAAKRSSSGGPDFAACVMFDNPAVYQYSARKEDTNNPGTFTVLTDARATLAITPNALHRGETLTISGQNWTPTFNDNGMDARLNIAIGTCNSGAVLGSLMPTVNSDHSFSATFVIPASATSTTYQVCAATKAQNIDNNPGSSQAPPVFNVLETPPTPTPAPATPTPLVTGTRAQMSPIATASGGGGSGGSGNDNTTLAIVLGIIALLLLGGGALFFALAQRRPPPAAGPVRPLPPRPPSGPPAAPGYQGPANVPPPGGVFSGPLDPSRLPEQGANTLPNQP